LCLPPPRFLDDQPAGPESALIFSATDAGPAVSVAPPGNVGHHDLDLLARPGLGAHRPCANDGPAGGCRQQRCVRLSMIPPHLKLPTGSQNARRLHKTCGLGSRFYSAGFSAALPISLFRRKHRDGEGKPQKRHDGQRHQQASGSRRAFTVGPSSATTMELTPKADRQAGRRLTRAAPCGRRCTSRSWASVERGWRRTPAA